MSSCYVADFFFTSRFFHIFTTCSFMKHVAGVFEIQQERNTNSTQFDRTRKSWSDLIISWIIDLISFLHPELEIILYPACSHLLITHMWNIRIEVQIYTWNDQNIKIKTESKSVAWTSMIVLHTEPALQVGPETSFHQAIYDRTTDCWTFTQKQWHQFPDLSYFCTKEL